MIATKRLLIEWLGELAWDGEQVGDDPLLDDELRARLLLMSSHDAESCALVDALSYELLDEPVGDDTITIAGLAVPEAGMHISDVVRGLRALPPPEALLEQWPDLSPAGYRAALFAIEQVLTALERNDVEGRHARRFDDATCSTLVRGSLRSLRHFRETGEP